MPSPAPTLALDDDGDILVSALGITRLTDDLSEEVAQRLRAKLQMFLGEWFLDKREGFPYHREVLKKNPNMSAIRSLIADTVQSDPGVQALLSLDLALDSAARTLTGVFEAQVLNGDVITETIGSFVL